jgi:hypothetical protein
MWSRSLFPAYKSPPVSVTSATYNGVSDGYDVVLIFHSAEVNISH